MRKVVSDFESIFFVLVSIGLFLAYIAAIVLRSHFHFSNARVAYGMEHLPAALLSVFLFTVFFGILRAFLLRSPRLEVTPSSYFVAALVALFCLYWMPVFVTGGFVQDDWMLLSAASIRKIILTHPAYSWYALDSVDGNFRPLGTVLYFGYMLKFFGLHPSFYLAGNFIVNLLGSILAFFLVRELGYSKTTGAAASIIYMSRGIIYTQNAWASDLGDGMVILLCGLTVLIILKANKRDDHLTLAYHAIAWGLFFLSTLAKQSAFVTPMIVTALIFINPGPAQAVSLNRRIRNALIAFTLYSGTAAIVFFHAKSLLQSQTPYPIKLSLLGVMESFSYIFWCVIAIGLPAAYKTTNTVILFTGVAIVLGLGILVWRVPRALGPRPRDVAFLLIAAVVSISLFIFLASHIAPYYGAMCAFWLSMALAVALTSFGDVRPENLPARVCCIVFCLLAISGYLDIRLKQTALIPSGGYLWGTFGMDRERTYYEQLQRLLASNPRADTLVFVDSPGYSSYYVSMALLANPAIKRILTYDSKLNTFRANNHEGCRPKDNFDSLRNAGDYNWTVPIDSFVVAQVLSQSQVLWVGFNNMQIQLVHSIKTEDSDPTHDLHRTSFLRLEPAFDRSR